MLHPLELLEEFGAGPRAGFGGCSSSVRSVLEAGVMGEIRVGQPHGQFVIVPEGVQVLLTARGDHVVDGSGQTVGYVLGQERYAQAAGPYDLTRVGT